MVLRFPHDIKIWDTPRKFPTPQKGQKVQFYKEHRQLNLKVLTLMYVTSRTTSLLSRSTNIVLICKSKLSLSKPTHLPV